MIQALLIMKFGNLNASIQLTLIIVSGQNLDSNSKLEEFMVIRSNYHKQKKNNGESVHCNTVINCELQLGFTN